MYVRVCVYVCGGGGRGGGREPWINVLALTCPSTSGDRGTANSVGSCSRQAAGLFSAQRSASFAPEREPSAKIGPQTEQQTRLRAGCSPPHSLSSPRRHYIRCAERRSAREDKNSSGYARARRQRTPLYS